MKPLRSRAVEQSTLSSPLRILAVADGGTAVFQFTASWLAFQPRPAAIQHANTDRIHCRQAANQVCEAARNAGPIAGHV